MLILLITYNATRCRVVFYGWKLARKMFRIIYSIIYDYITESFANNKTHTKKEEIMLKLI